MSGILTALGGILGTGQKPATYVGSGTVTGGNLGAITGAQLTAAGAIPDDLIIVFAPYATTITSSVAGKAWVQTSYNSSMSYPHVCVWKHLVQTDLNAGTTHTLSGNFGPEQWVIYRDASMGLSPVSVTEGPAPAPTASVLIPATTTAGVGMLQWISDRDGVTPASGIPAGWTQRESAANSVFTGQLVDKLSIVQAPSYYTNWTGFAASYPQVALVAELLTDDGQYIPVMPANDHLGFKVTSSLAVGSDFYAYDNVIGTRINGVTNGWTQLECPTPRRPTHYELTTYSASFLTGNWTIQGSNDGTTFTDLDTRGTEAFLANITRRFKVTNRGSYKFLRMAFGANSYYRINQLSYLSLPEIPVYANTTELSATDHGSSLTVSPDGFSVTNTATGWKSGRGTIGKTSGKWYYEMTLATGVTSGNLLIGLATSAASMSTYLTADAYSVGFTNSGQIKIPINTVTTQYGSLIVTAGDTIRVAVDLDLDKVWIGKVGDTNWNGQPQYSQGGTALPAGLTTGSPEVFPAYSLYTSGNGLIANFGNDNFRGEIPVGYQAWDAA